MPPLDFRITPWEEEAFQAAFAGPSLGANKSNQNEHKTPILNGGDLLEMGFGTFK
jgi:hypothetical protein